METVLLVGACLAAVIAIAMTKLSARAHKLDAEKRRGDAGVQDDTRPEKRRRKHMS